MSASLQRVKGAGTARTSESEPPGGQEAQSSPDRVVEAILDGLRSGRYGPGHRLVEADLTQELKVSRGPVREALKRLSAEGIVGIAPHRGAFVRALSRGEVADIMEVQEVLTGLAARLAARRIHDGDNARLVREAYANLAPYRDADLGAVFHEQRRHFHDALILVAGNPELQRVMPRTHVQLLRLQFQQYLTALDRARQFDDYDAIAVAVLAGDPRKAETAMRRHIRHTLASWRRLPEAAFAASDG